MSTGTQKAAQAALAAEHAAVYGYGVVGGRVAEGRRSEATAAYHAHRARRDALVRTVRGLGGEPVAAQAAYALPFAVPDPAAAVRLAAVLEDRVAGVYSDLVRAAEGPLRREAADALREAAVRAVRWRGSGVPFPGLAERTADGNGAKAGTAVEAGSGANRGSGGTNGSGATH
ncbi:ferritin-like domain-containing protein [Streptomyces sp. NBC_01591]|uniref:ferritin-like domain-containing protein n=1 Tax=Streptomyces sp. NBC_01591 TaxID=2975888 RepID=UPI002DDBC11A|nr:ferritin-like domain-containing protein [Streptomyces sp. NBC_01591]WSD71233.1 ferritin-like domain-containing protein [Streptomyces sp. NBC_01591]